MNKSLKALVRRVLPRSIGPRRIWSGPVSGGYLVTSWHDYPAALLGTAELPLLRWFAENVHAGETWLDIGAHYGYTAIALSRLVGPEGRVYAFEPMLATAGSIARAKVINNLPQLTVVPMALSQCADVTASSLPSTRGMIDSTIGETGPFEPFLAASLDWLWPRISEANGHERAIDGMKIDVQGMEIYVLKGMLETLDRYRPRLVIEIHEGVSRPELLKLLDTVGYSAGGTAIEQVDSEPLYTDNRSYAFANAKGDMLRGSAPPSDAGPLQFAQASFNRQTLAE
jgi:FkbM family methyltransferase